MRAVKFYFVGGIGIGVQLGVLALLKSGLHVSYLPATALAVEAAVVHNFIWHERFTWADRASVSVGQAVWRLAKFNLTTGLISVAGNVLLMRALVGEFGMNYLAANVTTIAALALANFFASDQIVFRARRADRSLHCG